MRLAFSLAIGWAVLPAAAMAGERLDADRIRAEIVGNTLTGRMLGGMSYSEYYAPDGVILGHNGGRPVTDGCWSIRSSPRGDEMCFGYGRGETATSQCWFLERSGKTIVIVHRDRGVDGIGVVEPGNLRQHRAAAPWSCDMTVSGRIGAAVLGLAKP
jgi:hypothetical protein